MRRVKELLRLAHELGYSKRQIGQSIRMPKTTVSDYLTRAAAAGVRYADVAGMSEEAVEALLFQRAELPEQRPMPDWEWVSAELGRRGVTPDADLGRVPSAASGRLQLQPVQPQVRVARSGSYGDQGR
jgi:hypothetical protein